MLEGKGMIEETDMPLKMQAQALTSASRALDLYEVFDCIPIAAYIKKVISKSLLQTQFPFSSFSAFVYHLIQYNFVRLIFCLPLTTTGFR